MSASHRRAIQVFFLLLLFAAATALAKATTFMRMSLAQMSGSARMIVRARCIAAGAIWDSGEIWTRTTFEVPETWRGASGSQVIAVRLLGGTLGNISSRVSGIPRFQRGEEAVLFLEPSANGDFSIVSWQQGTFRIRRNPANRRRNRYARHRIRGRLQPGLPPLRTVRNSPHVDREFPLSGGRCAGR